jgi:hypothetical protein
LVWLLNLAPGILEDMSDVFIDAFNLLLAKGMTYMEALQEFDRAEWNKAMLSEDASQYDSRRMLELAGKAGREEMNARDMEQAMVLWLDGWKSEIPEGHKDLDVMSWYWRRPARREGKPGRRFLSTNQAYKALKKEKRDAFVKEAIVKTEAAGGALLLKYVYTFCGLNLGYSDQSHAEIIPPLQCEEVISAGFIGLRLYPTPIVKLQREGSTTLKVGWRPQDLEPISKAFGFSAMLAD